MSNEILSQDEVDALLKGVTGEQDAPAESAPADGVRPYNLARQERIVRGRMPTLEIVNDRFARLLRIGLFNFMRRSPEISVGTVKVTKYSEFLRNMMVPTNLNIMQVRPLRGNSLFVFEPNLVFAVVDTMFGGSGALHTRVEGRDFTATEQRIIQRMLSVVSEEYQKSWAPVYALQFEFLRSEMHTQFANIATPSEIVVATSFSIELGNNIGGDIHICIPYATIEPIRDILYSPMQGDNTEPDRRWMRMLAKQVQIAEVDLRATLAEIPATVGQLLSMKPGDVIGIDLDEHVVADVDGVPIFECRYGTLNGQYALQVDRVLAIPQKENSLGD
ncbi:MAG: flagellar motor switch protein FliM [Betaproteobacteria bacterium]|nr:flagellar motor switch protein FliM [Betaproteobacteria bacterium]